jgi:hypothetical protein
VTGDIQQNKEVLGNIYKKNIYGTVEKNRNFDTLLFTNIVILQGIGLYEFIGHW